MPPLEMEYAAVYQSKQVTVHIRRQVYRCPNALIICFKVAQDREFILMRAVTTSPSDKIVEG